MKYFYNEDEYSMRIFWKMGILSYPQSCAILLFIKYAKDPNTATLVVQYILHNITSDAFNVSTHDR